MEEARLEIEKHNREVRGRRSKLEADLAKAKRRSERLTDQVAGGVLSGAAIKDKLAALEAQRTTLEAELATEEMPSSVSLHPEDRGARSAAGDAGPLEGERPAGRDQTTRRANWLIEWPTAS